MRHLKYFNDRENYNKWVFNEEYLLPSVSTRDTTDIVVYKSNHLDESVGDVVFIDSDGNLGHVPWKLFNSPDSGETFLGTPVGVLVIPKNMLKDGMGRFISLHYASEVPAPWCTTTATTNTTKTAGLPMENGSIAMTGKLPSDKFNGINSYTDVKSRYETIIATPTASIVAPYLNNGKLNPYYENNTLYENNALSFFDGEARTYKLKEEMSDISLFPAITLATNFNPYNADIKWYLPTIGELGIAFSRINKINKTIKALGGTTIDGQKLLWSVTEISNTHAYLLGLLAGNISSVSKQTNAHIRAFAKLI